MRSKRIFHIVSGIYRANRVSLAQISCDEKSNEITAIPRLLKVFDRIVQDARLVLEQIYKETYKCKKAG